MGLAPFSQILSPWVGTDNPYSNTYTQPSYTQPTVPMFDNQYGMSTSQQAFNSFAQPQASGQAFQNKFLDQANGYGQGFNKFTDQGMSGFESQREGAGGLGKTSQVGGNWSALDRFNSEFDTASQMFGVPANLLKAMVNRESSGNWERDNRIHTGFRNDQMLPFVGIFRNTANAWGLNFDQMVGNRQAQINGMATILKGLSEKYGGYENAAKVYFGGEAALNGGFTDELGMDSNTYGNTAVNDWRMLDQKAGYSGGYGDGGVGTNIVSTALQYVGVPYVWGSLPQAGDDPWKTGWDCSAFVNYLDDKFGANELPAGSHYQYQDSVNKGLLFNDTNQLQAGDLIFFDTGNTAGGGANLNRAGHVGMYIGNGQFVQAANPGAGTIVSNLSDYMQMYQFLGGRHMQWSGGGGYTAQQTQPSFSSLWQRYLGKTS